MMLEETNDFQKEIIELHYIAHKIEKHIGKGQLSEDLRNVADRLHAITKKEYYAVS